MFANGRSITIFLARARLDRLLSLPPEDGAIVNADCDGVGSTFFGNSDQVTDIQTQRLEAGVVHGLQ
jgi:hypothetical protein